MTSFTGRLTIPEQPSVETTKQPAPLGGRYGTGWSLPPDNAPADVMATARLAGHEWDDIENYYGEVYDKAQQVGHSAEAVDKHFGYPDRKPLDDQTEQQIKRQLQVAPDLRSVLDASDPVKAINDNAGLMIRDAYADALMAGQVKTPGDFTAKFFGHYLQAVHAGDDGRVPPEEKEKSQAVAQALAATLPTQRDAVDYAIALAGQGDLPFTPALVNVVKGNLMDEYAATGQSLTDIFNRAQKDPELNARLTQPVSDQPDWSISTALGRIWEEAKKGAADAYEAPLANGRDFWGIKPDDNTPTNNARILGYVASKDLDAIVRSPIALTLAGARAGAQILKEAGISEADADRTMRDALGLAVALGAKEKAPGAQFKVPTFDPLKTPGKTTGEFPTQSLIAEDGKPINPLEVQSRVEKLQTEGKAVEAGELQKQVEGLAEGYNVSNAVLSMFHNLMIDQSGALNLSLNLFRTTEQIMERANKIEANEYAKARVREFRGMADQIVAGLSHQLEKYRRDINQHLPDYAKWLRQGAARDANNKPLIQNLIDYMEGRSTGALLDPHSPFAPVADALRGVNEFMRAQIEAHDPNLINFYQDYFRHLWVNPRAADVAFGVGRQGTSRSLLARTVPTISEGIEKGLMPKILDPIDNTLHYVSGMANYLAARKVIDISKDAGYIKYGGEAPHPGWEKLNGMSSVVAAGDNAVQYAWAQQGYARAYNAWVGKGFHEWAVGGTIYDKLQYAANAMTGMKLALSQYHLFNIAKETGIAGLTNGLGEIARGDIIQGMLHMASGATILPELVRQRNAGKRFQEMYLDLGNQSEMVDLFAAAGGRAVGRGAQYRINQASNIQTALRRGSLFQELGNDIRSMFREQGGDENIPYRIARFPDRAAGVFMHEVGRVLDSLNGPLFDGLIPKVKNAAWADEMEAWLRHNMQASREEKLAMSRKILDSMDMRFGEMNQDNLFWNRMLKQTLNLFTVSVGWEYGTFAAFGTGARDIMKGSFNTTNARWTIGFPAMIAITSSIYMYMKTGGFPQSIRDVLVPPTDGTLADLQTPERNLMPGYEKDVLQWYKIFQLAPDFTGSFQNSLKYMGNKLNPFWQAWITLGTGQDKIGHYVLNEPHPPFESWGLPPRWGNTLRTIAKEMTPILADQKEMRGSNISRLERYFGFRPASLFDTDPAQAQARMEKEERRRDKVERRRDAREKAKEAPAPWLPSGSP